MARACALGKANETSGLTEPSRYSIYRADAHAAKPTGDHVWLNRGAASWSRLPKLDGPPDVTFGAVESRVVAC